MKSSKHGLFLIMLPLLLLTVSCSYFTAAQSDSSSVTASSESDVICSRWTLAIAG